MEEEVLAGASSLIAQYKPMMFVEVIKSDRARLNQLFDAAGYTLFDLNMNVLAVHNTDPGLQQIELSDGFFYVNS